MKKEENCFAVVASDDTKRIIKILPELSENKKIGFVCIFNLKQETRKKLARIYKNNSNVYIDENESLNMEYIEKKCKELKKDRKNMLVVLDYTRTINENEDIIGRKLKQLQNDLKIDIEIVIKYSYKKDRNIILNLPFKSFVSSILLHLTKCSIVGIELEKGHIKEIEQTSLLH